MPYPIRWVEGREQAERRVCSKTIRCRVRRLRIIFIHIDVFFDFFFLNLFDTVRAVRRNGAMILRRLVAVRGGSSARWIGKYMKVAGVLFEAR
jgi:hypothetical protein